VSQYLSVDWALGYARRYWAIGNEPESQAALTVLANALGSTNGLADALRDRHRQGSLHIMDRGQVCIDCGGSWPCRTITMIDRHS